ncbi:MAG: IS66 family insertion sequence element accessory protein TnpA, partial [Parahaliea sp.]
MHTQDHQNNWQQHITAWQASELSGAAFCREHGLTYHRFTYW